MNYLFFDIECANCDFGNGKICSFGYVITNDALEITETEDIIINPKAPFHLRSYGQGAKENITLAYPESVFRSATPFPAHYEKIRSLLTAPDTVIFGYAPENDAGFLRSEFERYRLAPVDFRFYDVQRLFKCCTGDGQQALSSLSAACEALGISPDIANHKSSSDALATAMVLKELCRLSGLSPAALTEKHRICEGMLKNGELSANYFKPKPRLAPSEKNMLKGINKDRFKNVIRRLAVKRPFGGGKRFCFSRNYEYRHFSEMCVIASELMKNGYRYTAKVSECDVFVKKPPNIGGECQKLIAAEALRAVKDRPEIIEFDELLKRIDLTHRSLSVKARAVQKSFDESEQPSSDSSGTA